MGVLKFMEDDESAMFGTGKVRRLAALIMEAKLAVFIVTMEGGHGSMNGR